MTDTDADTDGTKLERITFKATPDGFTMLSNPVFTSNRDQKARGETNIFIAAWVE